MAQVNVGIVERVKNITSNYNASLTDDNIFVDASGGAVTVTLPAASGKKGKVIKVVKTDSSTNAVTANSTPIYTQNNNLKFISNGSSWYTESNKTALNWASMTEVQTGVDLNTTSASMTVLTFGGTRTFYGKAETTTTSGAFGLKVTNMPPGIYMLIFNLPYGAVDGSNTQCHFQIYNETSSTVLTQSEALNSGSSTQRAMLYGISAIVSSSSFFTASYVFRTARDAGSNGQCNMGSVYAGPGNKVHSVIMYPLYTN
jgi:hypothetical protein